MATDKIWSIDAGLIPENVDLLVTFTALGEPASKANQRKFVRIKGKPAFIKSAKALAYVSSLILQCPRLDPLLDGDLIVAIRIYYGSRRPDLDESVILDAMQGKVYKNDRQVKEKHIYWDLDRNNPRIIVAVGKLS